jgi:single-stranded DNA-binding protein
MSRETYFNQVTLMGIIGNEPTLSFYKDKGIDKEICNFTLYVNDEPFQIAAWCEIGKSCFQWKHKGDKVLVTGSIKQKIYMQEGTEVAYKWEMQVTAKEVVFLRRDN